jgi:hypothetical protein
LLFFPLAAFLMVDAREFIILLFTRRYMASAPIFMVWSAMILLTTFQVDGVMRVFAQTRFLLALNLMRLAIVAGLIQWCLGEFRLLGAVLVVVLATVCFKAGALIRMKRLLGIGAVNLLPWRSLGALLAAAACGAVVVLAIKSQVHVPPLPLILATGTAYAATYSGLVWRFDLLNESERLAISGWVRRARIAIGLPLDYERG